MQEHEAHGSSETEITTGGTDQLKALVSLIGNDAFAMSFQSVRQYREALLAAAPAVQVEPVAWSGWGCQYPGKMPRLYGDRRIAELNCDWGNGDQVLYFTAAPQPAEQQPAPDVAAPLELLTYAAAGLSYLNDALESLAEEYEEQYNGEEIRQLVLKIDAALAAHRKGGA